MNYFWQPINIVPSLLSQEGGVSLLWFTIMKTHRLALRVTNTPDEEGDQLWAQDQAMEGQRSEAFLHGPLFTGRLVGVQVGVGSVSVTDLICYKLHELNERHIPHGTKTTTAISALFNPLNISGALARGKQVFSPPNKIAERGQEPLPWAEYDNSSRMETVS